MDQGRAEKKLSAPMNVTALVPLQELAAWLGVDRSVARKFALKHGFAPVKRQIRALGHSQMTLCWTPQQVEQIKAERRRQGFELPSGRASSDPKAMMPVTAQNNS